MARVLTEEEQAQHEGIHGRFGGARAQLWARVYRDELKLWRICLTPRGETPSEAHLQLAQGWARKAAAEAVWDFDEHYLGGKR